MFSGRKFVRFLLTLLVVQHSAPFVSVLGDDSQGPSEPALGQKSNQHVFAKDQGLPSADSPPIKAMLRAPFASPHILLELGEIIYSRNPNYYFLFLDYLTKNPSLFDSSPEKAYKSGMDWLKTELLASNSVSSSDSIDWIIGLSDLDLSVHTKAPKIIAQFQYYLNVVSESPLFSQSPNTHPPSNSNSNNNNEKNQIGDCHSWVWWNGNKACNQDDLEKLVESQTFYGDTYKSPVTSFPVSLSFDHIYPSPNPNKHPDNVAILYGHPSSTGFSKLNNYLIHLSNLGDTKYILRLIPPHNSNSPIVSNGNLNGMELSGYSVELVLKSTEYKVIDESNLFSNTDGQVEGSGNEWNFGENHYKERSYISKKPSSLIQADNNSTIVTNIDKDLLINLSKNIAEEVLNASEPLEMLEWITGDFPKYTHLFTHPPKNKTRAKIAQKLSKKLVGVKNVITLNGLAITPQSLNPFEISNMLENERKVSSSLQSLGLSSEQAIHFISSPMGTNPDSSPDSTNASEDLIYDISDKNEGRLVIGWLNDLSNDLRYKKWPSGISSIFYSQGSSSLPQISENIVSSVSALDLSTIDGIQFFTETIIGAIKKDYPFRFGIVPMSSTFSSSAILKSKTCVDLTNIDFSQPDQSLATSSLSPEPADTMARVFYYLYHFAGIRKTTEYFTQVLKLASSKNPSEISANTIIQVAESAYNSIIFGTKNNQSLKKIKNLITNFSNDKDTIDLISQKYRDDFLSWDLIKSDPVLGALLCKHSSYVSRLNLIAPDTNQVASKDELPNSQSVTVFANGNQITDLGSFVPELVKNYQQSSYLLLTKLLSGSIPNTGMDILQEIISSTPHTAFRNQLITSKCFLDSKPGTKLVAKSEQVGILSLFNSDFSNSQTKKIKQWLSGIEYLYIPSLQTPQISNSIPTTIWLWANLDSVVGRNRIVESLQSALDLCISGKNEISGFRISIFHVPKSFSKDKTVEEDNDEEGDNQDGDTKNVPKSKEGKLIYFIMKKITASGDSSKFSSNEAKLLATTYIQHLLKNKEDSAITGQNLIDELKNLDKKSKLKLDLNLANDLVETLNKEISNIERDDEISSYYNKYSADMVDLIKVSYGGGNWDEISIFKNGFQPDDFLISISGRLFPVVKSHQQYNSDVVKILLAREYAARIGGSEKAFSKGLTAKESKKQKRISADTFLQTLCILEQSKMSSISDSIFQSGNTLNRLDIFEGLDGYEDFTFEVSTSNSRNKNSNIYAHFKAFLDPISDDVQDVVPFLRILSKIPGIKVSVMINTFTVPESLPLRQFKRFVFNHKPLFDSKNGGQRVGVGAEFNNMPKDALLTLEMNVPSSWVVSATKSDYDLDNINLKSVNSKFGIAALFSLNSVLIEGHAQDTVNKSPPSGLQVVLSKGPYSVSSNKSQFDNDVYSREKSNYGEIEAETIVMSNLGYFQLQGQFGVYSLSTREGRSSRMIEIICLGANSYSKCSRALESKYVEKSKESNNYGVIVSDSFNGVTVYPVFSKRAGMEKESILASGGDEDKPIDEGVGIWESAMRAFNKMFGAKDEPNEKEINSVVEVKEADLNIFAVASGHLYERLMSIMIASVVKHTKSTVKFWIIENFMSPSFKKFVPILAAQYKFQYEFVTYKWPHWLHSEKEKQRTIWGYKILFLDVLFPLKLKRVIFVDADQIVRADLQELSDTDLEGAPYGYVPFCEDRKEIEGYRFWKVGYWKTHLKGRPYHISALYVVDLTRFRELGAGDKLRYQYQSLSSDKNSLSNLDQDLPNNIQHIVPIYSLDQDWLWCETWCSDQGLERAKTIDLCNNPMTKEPKLERAKRLIPEWNVYDAEIQKLRTSFNSDSSQKKEKPDEYIKQEL
ncbi:UDP-glucose:glycoprotein glucosyltransferase [Smittium mucronatum]|uniref:UDP-glucose:glycoprotein glucosyltransferase n=1 Tax=Smittium mucronatum TaxID=133383 RepID=A0A1R0GSC2_9FUNG|nr:UDP-glucose:glycoprotein glucosyltransferase [Smittium mucronatum]